MSWQQSWLLRLVRALKHQFFHPQGPDYDLLDIAKLHAQIDITQITNSAYQLTDCNIRILVNLI